MGDVTSTNETKFYIAAAATTVPANAAAYAALTWIEVDFLESLNEYGSQSSAVNFDSLNQGRRRKGKGIRDEGDVTVTVAHVASDLGQQAMVAAEKTPFLYPCKIELNNKPNPTGTNEVHYFTGKVMSARFGGMSTDGVVRRTFVVGIDSNILAVAPTAGS